MEIIQSIVLGCIQGITEFLPISSSGHLVIAHELIDFSLFDDLSFDVALHLGTLVAILVFFWGDIRAIIVAFFRSFANWKLREDQNQRIAWFLVAATVPGVIAGIALSDLADSAFRNLWLVAGLLIGVGVLFLVVERFSRQRLDIANLGFCRSVLIGCAQALALLPGVSRSGMTIVTGIFFGLSRQEAARFSFLLSAPIVFGAGMKKMLDAASAGISSDQWMMMLAGFITSAIVGYIAIAFLLRYLEHHKLSAFAYYRFALGAGVIAYVLLR
ncbi:MAG: undecaprenyl-diphosphatase UppP [Patescibacteria group bacterium]|nr:undecaprenyl-diphosphatase UppP [Patescibacteria group bacterium]MDD5715254.1 undecaprenyl-diphosphatase UppP [Patescibacteria group bacterium]